MKNKKSFLYVMLTIAFPIALQNLLTTTASMVDTIMIGRLGESCVAAVGICSQISSLFFSCYWGFASASILFFSQYWGADDEKGINRTFGITFICMAIVGFAFASLCIIRPEFLLGVYTDKEVFIRIGKPYMRIVGWAYPLQVFAVLISFLLRSTERVKAPLICSIVGLVVNFCLNFVLIYGKFGAPKMGAAVQQSEHLHRNHQFITAVYLSDAFRMQGADSSESDVLIPWRIYQSISVKCISDPLQ